jgi:hypothetical protein
MSQSGGAIICRQRYAQGKMLDHSGWRLARGVTPSDIDMVVESYGCFLWAELTRGGCDWQSLKTGQRILYDSLAKVPGNHIVCLARHSVPADRDIDTFHDIEAVAVRWCLGTKQLLLKKSQWQTLVTEWVSRPHQVVAWLDRHHASMTENSNGR